MGMFKLAPKGILLKTAIETLKQDNSISDEDLFNILEKEALKRMYTISEESIQEIIYFARECIKVLKEVEEQ